MYLVNQPPVGLSIRKEPQVQSLGGLLALLAGLLPAKAALGLGTGGTWAPSPWGETMARWMQIFMSCFQGGNRECCDLMACTKFPWRASRSGLWKAGPYSTLML